MTDASFLHRRTELERQAPIAPRGVFARVGSSVFLCGTIGVAFDRWQRTLGALSMTDAYIAQQIGLVAVEREMDRLEAEAKSLLSENEELRPRRSPGYPGFPISMNREIVAALDATRRIGVSVSEALLLLPSKSVTAICEIVKRKNDHDE